MMIISNATPLIAFARIGRLSLFRDVLGNVVIPKAVANELSDYRGYPQMKIDLSRESWISVQEVSDKMQVQLLLTALDRGEAEVIALAIEKSPALIIMDELTGRTVAESLELPVSGSVGVLIRAKQANYIPAVKPVLEEMLRRGIRFSPRFIKTVLSGINET